MTHNQKGSATLHSLFAALLLLTALAAATLWSTISTTRHKLATAADLTALSAAQSLTTAPSTQTPTPDTPAPNTSSGPNPPSSHGPGPDTAGPDSVTPGTTGSRSTAPCLTAARIAALHNVDLVACQLTPTSVTIQVAAKLHLPFTHPTLTTTSRAGPL